LKNLAFSFLARDTGTTSRVGKGAAEVGVFATTNWLCGIRATTQQMSAKMYILEPTATAWSHKPKKIVNF
jgi:hypothetical protein